MAEANSTRVQRDANTKSFPKNELVPDSFWADLATSYEVLSLKILRRNTSGQIQTTFGQVKFATLEMPKLDSWIRAHAGGSGAHPYEIQVRSPDEATKILVIFYLSIEGAVRPPILPVELTDQGPAEETAYTLPDGVHFSAPIEGYEAAAYHEDELAELAAMSAFPILPDLPTTDPSHASAPAEVPMSDQVHRPVQVHPSDAMPARGGQNWQSGQDPRPFTRPAPGVATMASDRLLLAAKEQTERALAEMTSEKKLLEQRLEEERRRNEDRERQTNERFAALERAAAEERHRAELAALNAKVEAALAAAQKSATPAQAAPTPAETMATMVGALAPLVPVFVAMVQSGKEERAAAITAQSQTQNAMLGLVTATAQKPAPDPMAQIAPLMALLQPLLTSMQPQKPDFGAMGQLMEASANVQMQSTAMMTQLLGAIAESGQPEQARSFMQEMIPQLPALGDLLFKTIKEMNAGSAPAPAPRQIAAGAPAQQPAQSVQSAPQVIVSRPATPLYRTSVDDVPASVPLPVPTPVPTPSAEAVVADAALSVPAEMAAQSPSEGLLPTPHLEAVEAAIAQADAENGVPEVMDGSPMPFDRSIFGFLPKGLSTSAWKTWIRSLYAGNPSDELGEALAELLFDIDPDDLPAPYAEQFTADPIGSLRMLAGMLPPTVSNPAYGDSIVRFAEIRLEELIAEHAEEEDDEEGADEQEEEDDREGVDDEAERDSNAA